MKAKRGWVLPNEWGSSLGVPFMLTRKTKWWFCTTFNGLERSSKLFVNCVPPLVPSSLPLDPCSSLPAWWPLSVLIPYAVKMALNSWSRRLLASLASIHLVGLGSFFPDFFSSPVLLVTWLSLTFLLTYSLSCPKPFLPLIWNLTSSTFCHHCRSPNASPPVKHYLEMGLFCAPLFGKWGRSSTSDK